jgi:hypothetical protein
MPVIETEPEDRAMDFWDFFWLLLIYIPLLLLWMFSLFDIFLRDDLSGLARAMWIIVVIILPVIGMIIYFAVRPAAADGWKTGRTATVPPPPPTVSPAGAESMTQLTQLADMHTRGQLTDAEFAACKARILGVATPSG